VALALALAASVLALAREVRIRRALEKLLHILLSRWRAHVSKNDSTEVDPVDSDRRSPGDRL
jgi:hypothetical protein